MTNVQEELTLALERRAAEVAVENQLDAILNSSNIVRSPTATERTRDEIGCSSTQRASSFSWVWAG